MLWLLFSVTLCYVCPGTQPCFDCFFLSPCVMYALGHSLALIAFFCHPVLCMPWDTALLWLLFSVTLCYVCPGTQPCFDCFFLSPCVMYALGHSLALVAFFCHPVLCMPWDTALLWLLFSVTLCYVCPGTQPCFGCFFLSPCVMYALGHSLALVALVALCCVALG